MATTQGAAMLDAIADGYLRMFDKDSSWWGLQRFRPARDRAYTSKLLLAVCLAYGLPLAALGWAVSYAAASFLQRLHPLSDDTAWLPRAAAWAAFVSNALLNGAGCWFWNRRAARTGPASQPGADDRRG